MQMLLKYTTSATLAPPSPTSSVTVFIERSCNKVFITQVTGLCRQLSTVVASSQAVMLRLAMLLNVMGGVYAVCE